MPAEHLDELRPAEHTAYVATLRGVAGVAGTYDRVVHRKSQSLIDVGNLGEEMAVATQQRHHAGHHHTSTPRNPEKFPQAALGVFEDVGERAAVGQRDIEGLVPQCHQVAQIELPVVLNSVVHSGPHNPVAVERELVRREVGHQDSGAQLGELQCESARPGTDLQDSVALVNEAGQKAAMDLQAGSTSHGLEAVPFPWANRLEVGMNRVHASP